MVNLFCVRLCRLRQLLHPQLNKICDSCLILICLLQNSSVFLVLLLLATVGEGRYEGLQCYKCDYIMNFCTFRCRHQPSVVQNVYCTDFCQRRNERCYLECDEDRYRSRRNWKPAQDRKSKAWQHYATICNNKIGIKDFRLLFDISGVVMLEPKKITRSFKLRLIIEWSMTN